MILLDGKKCAKELRKELKAADEKIGLVVIQVGNDAASNVYVRNKQKACEEVGFLFFHNKLNEDIEEGELISIIESYNKNSTIHGILVQLPLPEHLNSKRIMNSILPEKDVDAFSDINLGRLMSGEPYLVPCTAMGIMLLLEEYGIDPSGKNCVIVGRSDIVGKPMALCMLHSDATVTVCHSKTKNLKEICRGADILICAIGKPKFFNKEYIKEGAIVIDVGIHRDDNGKLCGDVDFENVKDIVDAITPVPGGVGPMTVASLLANCAFASMGDGLYGKYNY